MCWLICLNIAFITISPKLIFVYRNTKIFGVAHGRANEMTADEVITRLKDRMSQHSTQFRQAFLSYDRRGKCLVSKRDFRHVSS